MTPVEDTEIQQWKQNVSEVTQEIRRRCMEEGILTDYLDELGDELESFVALQIAAATDSTELDGNAAEAAED